ncbi:MAG: SAM domain-containing protein, partial [Rhodopila sp.]
MTPIVLVWLDSSGSAAEYSPSSITSPEETAVDVGEWLRNLGLAQYEAAFGANAIDAETLPTLTADDIKDLGVTPIGHRRRLLDAIAALRLMHWSAGTAGSPASLNALAALDEPIGTSETTAERRPLS